MMVSLALRWKVRGTPQALGLKNTSQKNRILTSILEDAEEVARGESKERIRHAQQRPDSDAWVRENI
jgi:hypothetical protein